MTEEGDPLAHPDDDDLVVFIDDRRETVYQSSDWYPPDASILHAMLPPPVLAVLESHPLPAGHSFVLRRTVHDVRPHGGDISEIFGVAIQWVGYVADAGGAGTVAYLTAKGVQSLYRRLSATSTVRVSIGSAGHLAAADLIDRLALEGDIRILGKGLIHASRHNNVKYWITIYSDERDCTAFYTVSPAGHVVFVGKD